MPILHFVQASSSILSLMDIDTQNNSWQSRGVNFLQEMCKHNLPMQINTIIKSEQIKTTTIEITDEQIQYMLNTDEKSKAQIQGTTDEEKTIAISFYKYKCTLRVNAPMYQFPDMAANRYDDLSCFLLVIHNKMLVHAYIDPNIIREDNLTDSVLTVDKTDDIAFAHRTKVLEAQCKVAKQGHIGSIYSFMGLTLQAIFCACRSLELKLSKDGSQLKRFNLLSDDMFHMVTDTTIMSDEARNSLSKVLQDKMTK